MTCYLELSVLLLLLVGGVLSSSSSEGVCDAFQITCVDTDDTCLDDFYHNPLCKDHCCPVDYFCVNSQCIMDSNGDDCDFASNCTLGLYGTGVVDCVDNECLELMNSGDDCDDDDDCAHLMNCDDDECQPRTNNATCFSSPSATLPQWVIAGQDCAQGYFCNNQHCTAMLKEGVNCTLYALPFCGMNLMCDPVQGKCIKLFSLEEGKSCDVRALYTCDEDTYCATKAGSTVGVCTSAVADEYEECEDNSECDMNRTCECFTNGHKYCDQKEYTQGPCMSELKDIYKCYDDNDCSTGVLSQNENSCQELNCAQELAKYRTCLLCDQYDLGTCLSSKEENRYCPAKKLELWEKLTILAVLVVVVLAIIAVIALCCLCQKKKDYQPI